MIFSVDPGCELSAYSILDNSLKPIQFGKIPNEELLQIIKDYYFLVEDDFVIEMVACYNMPVGQTIFETLFWIGRYWEACTCKSKNKIYRKKDVCINLCNSMKAKDSNIRGALIDRFGVTGTIKNKGWFFGVSKDIWSAIAVGVTYYDLYIKDKNKEKTNV